MSSSLPPSKGSPARPASQAGRAVLFPEATDAQWADWRWHQRNAVRNLAQLEKVIPLTPDERAGVQETSSLFRVGISPYYLSLIDRDHPLCPIRMQSIP